MAVDFDDDETMVKKREDTQTVHPRKPLCACTTYSCNKLFLFLYTWLFAAVGCGLLGFGVWVGLEAMEYEGVNKSLVLPSLLMIGVGFVIFINTLFGMAGALTENLCLLRTFLILTILGFLTQVGIGVLAFVFRQEIPGLTSEKLMFVVRGYHDNPHFKRALDHVQASFECCGLESYMDYEENKFFHCDSDTEHRCGVPWSCCRKENEQETFSFDCGYNVRWNATIPVDTIFTMGCTEVFTSWLSWRLDLVGIVGLGTAIPQIIGILLAYFFCRQVREMKMWYRVGM